MLGLHAHLNLTFAHLTALHHRFSLIEPKETEVLRDLEVALRLAENISSESGSQEAAEHAGDPTESDGKVQGDKTNGEKKTNV